MKLKAKEMTNVLLETGPWCHCKAQMQKAVEH